MKVADVMSSDVEFLDAEASVRDAAILMGELEVGAVPIGTPDSLLGILTDRDILYRVVARGRDPSTTSVREAMSQPVVTCRVDEEIRQALDLMAANYVRRLAVTSAGRVVGWLTLADLSRHLLVGSDALQTSLDRLTADPAAESEPAAQPR